MMVGYRYSTKVGENMSKAVSHNLPISTKISTQVCTFVKGMPVPKAKQALADVMKKKRAVPMKKHFKETAHKRGMAVGRYPIKAAAHVLKVLESAEANAQFKGLNSAELVVHHAAAQKGPSSGRTGRHGGKAKRTHIEIVLEARTASEKVKRRPTEKTLEKKE